MNEDQIAQREYENEVKSHKLTNFTPNDFNKFFNRKRRLVYRKMFENQLGEDRYEEFWNTNFKNKNVKELLQELLGSSKAKINEDVVWISRMAMKMYCGQLVEEARIAQMEEIQKQNLATPSTIEEK